MNDIDDPPSSSSDVASALASYAVDFSIDDVPTEIRERAKLVLLDTIGVCLRGSQTDYVRRSVENDELMSGVGPGSKGSTTFATFDRRSPFVAAFANAAGGTTLELDEGNQRSAHMGIHIVPPAVAIAEREGVSGTKLLEAIVAAYEASARVGDAIRPQRSGLHPHGTWAPTGSAIASGLLYDLDESELTEAIRIAANPFVAGHWAAALEGATVRNFYTGTACVHGMRSAMLARSGVTGVRGAIERCLFPYTAGDEDAVDQLAAATGTLGEEWYLESSYFKIHASCRYSHAPIEALERILEEHPIEPNAIESIRVSTFSAGKLLDNREPRTVLEAKFSTPYTLAALAVLGTTGVDAFDEEHVADDRIQGLASRVEVVEDPAFQDRAREGEWGATVSVGIREGKRYEETVKDARGGGDDPFSPTEVAEKFRSLVSVVDAAIDASSLEETLLEVDRVENCANLLDEIVG